MIMKAMTITEALLIYSESLQRSLKDIKSKDTTSTVSKTSTVHRAKYGPLTSFVKRAVKDGELSEAIKRVQLAWGISIDPNIPLLTEVHTSTLLALLNGLSEPLTTTSTQILSSEKRSDAALYLVRWFDEFNLSKSTDKLPSGLFPIVAKVSVYNALLRVFIKHGLPRDSLIDGIGTRFGDIHRLTSQNIVELGTSSIRCLWSQEKDLGKSASLAIEERNLPSIRRAIASGRSYDPIAERAYLWQVRDGLWLRERGHIPSNVKLSDVTAIMLNSGDETRAPAVDSESIIKQAVNNLGLAVTKASKLSRDVAADSKSDGIELVDLRPVDYSPLVDIPEGCSRSMRLIVSIWREMVGCSIRSNGILHTPRKWIPCESLPNGETVSSVFRLCENQADIRHVIDLAEATQTRISGPSLLIGVRISLQKLHCEQTAKLLLSRSEGIEKMITATKLKNKIKRTKKSAKELVENTNPSRRRAFEEAYNDAKEELIANLFKVRKTGRRLDSVATLATATSSLDEILTLLQTTQVLNEKVISSALHLYVSLGDQENVMSLATAILSARSTRLKSSLSPTSSMISALLFTDINKDDFKKGDPFSFKTDVKELTRIYAASIATSSRPTPSLRVTGLDFSKISIEPPLTFSISPPSLGVKRYNDKEGNKNGPSSKLVAAAVDAIGQVGSSQKALSIIFASFLAEAAHVTESRCYLDKDMILNSRLVKSYINSFALLGQLDCAVSVCRAGLVMGASINELTALAVVKNVLMVDELPYAFSSLRVLIDGGKRATDKTQQALMDLVSRLSRTALPVPNSVADAIGTQSLNASSRNEEKESHKRLITGLVSNQSSQINTARISAFTDSSLASAVVVSLKAGDQQQDVSLDGKNDSNTVEVTSSDSNTHPLLTAVSTSRSLATAIVRLTAQQLQLMADQRAAVVSITAQSQEEEEDNDKKVMLETSTSIELDTTPSLTFNDEDRGDDEDALDVTCEMLLLCLMEWPVSERMSDVRLELDSETAPRAALQLKRLSAHAVSIAATKTPISEPRVSRLASLPLFQMLEQSESSNNDLQTRLSFDLPPENASFFQKRPIPLVVAPALASLDYFSLGMSTSTTPPHLHSATMEDLTVALRAAAARARARVAKRAEKREGGAAVAKWDLLLTKIDSILSKLRSGKIALKNLHPGTGRSLAKSVAMIAVSGENKTRNTKTKLLIEKQQQQQQKSVSARLL